MFPDLRVNLYYEACGITVDADGDGIFSTVVLEGNQGSSQGSKLNSNRDIGTKISVNSFFCSPGKASKHSELKENPAMLLREFSTLGQLVQ